ncbi:MAG: hypothetical protein LBH84_09750 [Prevotellaceae bacterium]|nr:hypothetical protein [Prevotellaceae bacterium]
MIFDKFFVKRLSKEVARLTLDIATQKKSPNDNATGTGAKDFSWSIAAPLDE